MLTLLTLTALASLSVNIWQSFRADEMKAINQKLNRTKNRIIDLARQKRKEYYRDKQRIERKVTRRDEIIKTLKKLIKNKKR